MSDWNADLTTTRNPCAAALSALAALLGNSGHDSGYDKIHRQDGRVQQGGEADSQCGAAVLTRGGEAMANSGDGVRAHHECSAEGHLSGHLSSGSAAMFPADLLPSCPSGYPAPLLPPDLPSLLSSPHSPPRTRPPRSQRATAVCGCARSRLGWSGWPPAAAARAATPGGR